ncbi:UNVERIFIED_CONTAM: hypothetical protein Sradi_7087200 [Sesamum radiatum]|uniref:Reverse transcriptase domain-containing protein n=1 Tax=Sesamum radiatum TaxID=300843 RepID=A0AAW2J579_SESRA
MRCKLNQKNNVTGKGCCVGSVQRNYGFKNEIRTRRSRMLGLLSARLGMRTIAPTGAKISEAGDAMEARVMEIMNADHIRCFSLGEVQLDLKQMHPLKSLSPDEAFSNLVYRVERRGELQGVAVAGHAPRIFHLMFVDNTSIFCQASEEALECIKMILEKLEQASGLKINLDKSAMVFSINVLQAHR